MSQPALCIQSLHKTYDNGVTALKGVSLDVAPGDFFALLGPNGAGKSTLIGVVSSLVNATSGSVTVFGIDLMTNRSEAMRQIGLVPQEINFNMFEKPIDILVNYAGFYGVPREVALQRAEVQLKAAHLWEKAHMMSRTLSGGMKRRLTLARSLVNDPDLIFMDEPTTGLDPQARHLIWERLKALLARGKTILLTTHFMDEAERLATRLAVIDHGRKIAEGSPRDLIRAHIEPHVIEVYGDGAFDWAERDGRRLADRLEVSGETAFCYAAEPARLLQSLERAASLRYLHRPANLEDLFIKLTGRELRD